LKEEIEDYEEMKKELDEIEEFLKIAREDETGLAQEIKEKIERFGKKLEKVSLKIYLGGEHDKGEAILQIFAGAGGRDSQDWAAMLKRMYERYGERKGFTVITLDQSFSEAGGPEGRIGVKNATLEIKGKYAFGFLKREAGVHRLVRISPFSGQQLRHTSFAQIVVLPKLEMVDKGKMEIKESDLKIETFRASGPGGQFVQKTDSAVRITHLPTKVTVHCQTARSQSQNKKIAMEILMAKLYQRKKEEEEKNLKEIKGEIDPAWGKQIRNYVLHPYKLIKDLRTGVEVSNVEAILDGDLDKFIEAEIKLKI